MAKDPKLDVRNDEPFKSNYDYGDGLYFGNMDRYKSVKDFVNTKRRRRRARRKQALLALQENNSATNLE